MRQSMVCVSIHVQIKHVLFRLQYRAIHSNFSGMLGWYMYECIYEGQKPMSGVFLRHCSPDLQDQIFIELESSLFNTEVIGGYHHFQVLCGSWGSKCR